MKNNNQELLNELNSKNQKLEIYRSKKTNKNSIFAKKTDKNELNNFIINEDQYKKKILNLENEINKCKIKIIENIPENIKQIPKMNSINKK